MPSSFPGNLVVPFGMLYCAIRPHEYHETKIGGHHKLTSGALGSNINRARSRVRLREYRELGDERAHVVLEAALHLLLLGGMLSRAKPGARGHVVDVFLDLVRNVVRLGGHVTAAVRVLPHVEVCEQQLFHLLCRRVELNPLRNTGISLYSIGWRLPMVSYLFVRRQGDAVGRNARVLQPVSDSINTGLMRSKEVNDFLRAQMLPVVGRLRVRTRAPDQSPIP